MKKRLLSILLILVFCLSLMPAGTVLAEESPAQGETASQLYYSPWAQDDLVVGDTYGIYPQTWYTKGMTAPLKQAQLRVLLAGLRLKLLNTDCITAEKEVTLKLKNNMTVEEVLKVFHDVISGYEYTGSIGLEKNASAVEYMAETGVFTGNEGELALKDTCTVEQACAIATRLVTYIYNTLDAASKGFLWEVESGENKVYLLGSIHFANYDIYPFSDEILNAFASSDALAVELNMLDTTGAMSILESGVYTDGTTLKDHVAAETYEKTVKMAANFGYTEEMIAMYKPWCIFIMFNGVAGTDTASLQEAQTSANLGIDVKFIVDAMLTGKNLLEVEGYAYQAQVLDSFSPELEEYLLLGAVDSILNAIAGQAASQDADFLEVALKYWHEGDVEAFMEEIAPALDVPTEVPDEYKLLMAEYKEKLFTNRDKGMADYIDKLLKAEGSGTYFVVVGSGHYVSDYSVLDILEEKGYKITQIK